MDKHKQQAESRLIVDTSAWMGASLPGHTGMTLMDQARADALGWLRAVPADDRVLVIRADGLATPATGWETDHRAIARAILESEPGVTALGITEALQFALHSQQQAGGGRPGEIVYSGPGRIQSHGAIESSGPGVGNLPRFPRSGFSQWPIRMTTVAFEARVLASPPPRRGSGTCWCEHAITAANRKPFTLL